METALKILAETINKFQQLLQNLEAKEKDLNLREQNLITQKAVADKKEETLITRERNVAHIEEADALIRTNKDLNIRLQTELGDIGHKKMQLETLKQNFINESGERRAALDGEWKQLQEEKKGIGKEVADRVRDIISKMQHREL